MTVSKEAIARILTAFLTFYQSDPEIFDPKDVEMVQLNDWWIEHFNFTRNKDEEQVKRGLFDAFAWRKEFGVNDLKVEEFKPLIKKVNMSGISNILVFITSLSISRFLPV